MNQENVSLGVFVFSIIAFVFLLIISFTQSSITGNVLLNVDTLNMETNDGRGCADTDGTNINIKGTVRSCVNGDCNDEQDSCSGDRIVVEWYCQSNEAKFQERQCSNECDDGVCLSALTEYTQEPSTVGRSGHGGSSGRRASPGPAIVAYDVGDLSSEERLDVLNGEGVNVEFNGNAYVLVVTGIGKSELSMDVNGATVSFVVGSEKSVDLNSDSVGDIYIKVKAISTVNNKASLILNRV